MISKFMICFDFKFHSLFQTPLIDRRGIKLISQSNYREVKFEILKLWGKAVNLWENPVHQNIKRKMNATQNVQKKNSPPWTSKTLSPESIPRLKVFIILQPSTKSLKIIRLSNKSKKLNQKNTLRNTANPWIKNTSFPESKKCTSYTDKSQEFFNHK